jgi:uncharacterized protein YbjT (DUF2867 family)
VIALTGATGFVGSRLLARLQADGREVRCLTRNPEKLDGCDAVKADVLDPGSLQAALDGADTAYYLVHAIGDSGAFDETEAEGARNFAEAASAQGVDKIVYLGGLAHGGDLSDHMRSRHEVGEILASTGVDVVELRASIVIGPGSLSFELVRTLVDSLPVLVLPSWADTSCQPLAVDDLVEYLVAAAEVPAGIYEIGGADVLTYRDLISAYGDEVGKGTLQVSVPLPSPIADSADLPTILADLIPERARAATKLVESLRFDSTVQDPAAAETFAVEPRGVREAIRSALDEGD